MKSEHSSSEEAKSQTGSDPSTDTPNVSPDEDSVRPWNEFMGQEIVIDTATRFVYLGTLVDKVNDCLVLEEVDVHDSDESKSTKEVYIMESAKHGIRVNRKKVMVPEHRVLSVSLLQDTIIYN